MVVVAIVAVFCTSRLWVATFPEEAARRQQIAASHAYLTGNYRENWKQLLLGMAIVSAEPEPLQPGDLPYSAGKLAYHDYYYRLRFGMAQPSWSYRDNTGRHPDAPEFSRLLREKVVFHAAMRNKWNRGAQIPWWPVTPDPPQPGPRIEVGTYDYRTPDRD